MILSNLSYTEEVFSYNIVYLISIYQKDESSSLILIFFSSFFLFSIHYRENYFSLVLVYTLIYFTFLSTFSR